MRATFNHRLVLTVLLAILLVAKPLQILANRLRIFPLNRENRFSLSLKMIPFWDNDNDESRATIVNEINNWFNNLESKGDFVLQNISAEVLKDMRLCTRRSFRLLFYPWSDVLGDLLYDHLAARYTNSTRKVIKKDLSLNKAAFDLKFINSGGLTQRFLNHIKLCFRKSQKGGDIYAPYFFFCQSSGYGKSKLIKKLATDPSSEFVWLYICLRKQGQYSYPKISATLLNSLIRWVSADGSAENAVIFFQNWIQYLRSQTVYPSWSDMEECKTNAFTFFEKSFQSSSVPNVPNTFGINPSLALLPPLIVVLDKASYLLDISIPHDNGVSISLFRLLRRALNAVNGKGRKVMFILIDTNPRVSEFTPPSTFDPSLRYFIVDDSDIKYDNLLPPFYHQTTADALVDYRELDDNIVIPLFLLGRPLWAAIWKTGKVNDVRLVNFARIKLFGDPYGPKVLKRNTALVPFAVCANLYLPHENGLGGELVASHMATLFGMSEGRNAWLAGYPSEPILAEVALERIGSMTIDDWKAVIHDFEALYLPGTGAGDRGELVGVILLLLARSNASKSRKNEFRSLEVPLVLYLESLLGESAKHIEKKETNPSICVADRHLENDYDEFIRESFISATHFVECSKSNPIFKDLGAPEELLKSLYRSRTALLLPNDWEGADALIAIRTPCSSTSSSNYSVILIQFKNRDQDSAYPQSATTKLSSSFVFQKEEYCDDRWKEVPCIRLSMQLGDIDTKSALFPPVNETEWRIGEKYYALAVFGLSAQVYPCLHVPGNLVINQNMRYDLGAELRKFLRPPTVMSPMASSDLIEWEKWDVNMANRELKMRDLRKIYRDKDEE